MKEIWKDIKNYEGLYQVSNLGNVRSLTRMLKTGTGYRIKKGQILKPLKTNKGYYRVNLKEHSKCHSQSIHRLVAEAFISNPNNYPVINHKDENPLNNRVDNLEWCTMKYNNNYGTHLEKISKKLSKKINQYDLDGNFIKQWKSIKEISEKLKITKISEVCRGRRNKCGGYIWRYAHENKNQQNINKDY